MRIIYLSGETIVCEATQAELQKLKGDENYTPAVDDQVNIDTAFDSWLWIKSKKQQILNAGAQLTALANKL